LQKAAGLGKVNVFWCVQSNGATNVIPFYPIQHFLI